jgi:hypothetical protein
MGRRADELLPLAIALDARPGRGLGDHVRLHRRGVHDLAHALAGGDQIGNVAVVGQERTLDQRRLARVGAA